MSKKSNKKKKKKKKKADKNNESGSESGVLIESTTDQKNRKEVYSSHDSDDVSSVEEVPLKQVVADHTNRHSKRPVNRKNLQVFRTQQHMSNRQKLEKIEVDNGGRVASHYDDRPNTKEDRKEFYRKHRPRYTINKATGRRRLKSGEGALREIRKYQLSTDLLIRRLPFSRLVRELCDDMINDRRKVGNFWLHRGEVRFQSSAMEALREAAEAFIVRLMEDANLCTLHRKLITVMGKDLHLALRLNGMVSLEAIREEKEKRLGLKKGGKRLNHKGRGKDIYPKK